MLQHNASSERSHVRVQLSSRQDGGYMEGCSGLMSFIEAEVRHGLRLNLALFSSAHSLGP